MMKRTLIFFGFSLTFFVGAVAAYVVWYGIVGAASIRVIELKSHIEAKDEETVQLSTARRTLALLEAQGLVLADYFVSEEDVVTFLERIEGTGQSVGTRIDVISVSQDTADKTRIMVSVQVDGTFDAVVRTLGALEYSAHDIQTTSLSVRKIDNGELGTTWNAAVTFSVGAQLDHES